MGTPTSRKALERWLAGVDYESAPANTKRSLNYYRKMLPAWPLWADEEKIKAIYKERGRVARMTGKKHHVDHSVPLSNPHVCGLHNEFNLVIITEKENLQKSNNTWPDMWMQQQQQHLPLEDSIVHQYALQV